MAGVMNDVVNGVRAISSRSGIGRRDTCRCVTRVGAGLFLFLHTLRDIDPGEPTNISFLLAFESIQAVPQSLCVNDAASKNM